MQLRAETGITWQELARCKEAEVQVDVCEMLAGQWFWHDMSSFDMPWQTTRLADLVISNWNQIVQFLKQIEGLQLAGTGRV